MSPFRRGLLVTLLGAVLVWFPAAAPAAPFSTNANRLAYLDESDPFYPHRDFPKLTTPQWVGEAGVEAVVILSIDDLRETPKYEAFLRPILERLKRIDGRAPVSIMINAVAPTNAQLQSWLAEGVSLEVHTLAHPCPCLAQGSFTNAANTYHGGVDLLNRIPGNRPVAFRMPCCDSMNSPSPRFYAEIFNRANPAGQFLTIDSSVMNLFTTNDPALPRELVWEPVDAPQTERGRPVRASRTGEHADEPSALPSGRERFRKYFPARTNAVTKVSLANFATTIEDYPYPYVLGKLCWEFPATVPSDWEAFNVHGSTNPVTLADWQAALDATVLKQGVFTFIFHPHGWSSPAQFVEFIDYAVARHGKKVKFLNFREAQERLDKNLLLGNSLRTTNGGDHGVRLLDLNNDGFLDVVVHNDQFRMTRVWDPQRRQWERTDGFPFPLALADRAGASGETGVRFGLVRPGGLPAAFAIVNTARLNDVIARAWQFDGRRWVEDQSLLNGLSLDGQPVLTSFDYRDRGVRFRDVNHDGRCECIVGNDQQSAIFSWTDAEKQWKKLSYALPPGTRLVDGEGRDAGLRFVDVNGDGYDDVLFSDEREFSLHLFVPVANERLQWKVGWNDEVFSGQRGQSSLDVPRIVRAGERRNNGVWFKHQTMWAQNEDTAHLPDKVARRTFRELLTADDPKPLAPAEALAAFRPRPGFRVERVAAEPLVQDPIAFEWGADGKLWVVEMGDYPLGLDGAGKPGGRIKFLEDTNSDGVYDRSTVFLDGVNFPTGVFPWRGGVIVSAAPEIFYAEDTDGDGKADQRTVLYTGFHEGNQQHRLNGFDYGLDNWLYGANGESGGRIQSLVAADVRRRWNNRGANEVDAGSSRKDQRLLTSAATGVSINNRDFRFQPDTGAFEAIPGTTQYGRHRDDWGNWFGNFNPTWLWHFFLPDHYLTRNPHLAVKSTKQILANYDNATRLYPASRTRQRFNDHHQFNHVTSANSPTPYRDDLFGPDFSASVFISDPVHNLVHREVLEPDGVTFKSRRAPDETNSEFLASTDNWFRPTMLKTGPDGALYVADMYRQVLEHPEWIPKWMQPRLDLRAGADQGRIYRVVPVDAARRSIPRLDQRNTGQLVAALDSPSGWQRDTAQRLLVHQRDPAAAAPLARLLDHPRAQTRLHALATLDGLGRLTPELLVRALRDAHAAVREHAVRLSEPFLTPTKRDEALGSALLKLAEDPSIRVRYQLAFTLGEWHDLRAAEALVRVAARDRLELPLQTAVLSSATNHVGEMLTAAFLLREPDGPPAELIEKLLGLATALHRDDVIEHALDHLAGRSQLSIGGARQTSGFVAFLDALDRRHESFDQFKSRARPALRETLAPLEKLFAAARRDAARPDGLEAGRLAAVPLLGRQDVERADDLKVLSALLGPANSTALQQAAVRALTRIGDEPAGGVLLGGWKGAGPQLRQEILNALLGRAAWLPGFVTEMERGQIPAGQISPAHQQALLKHGDQSIRARAEKLFTTIRPDRAALLQEYAPVNKLAGDAQRGAALFQQNCANCHRLRGGGVDLGPDLGALGGKDISTLLIAILDPNQAVEARYVNYTVVLRSGREVSGLLTGETPNNLALRVIGGAEETLLRSDIKELTSSGLSLMPEGFEKILKPQDMADLLAHLGASARR